MEKFNHFDQKDPLDEPIKPRPLSLKSADLEDDGPTLRDISFKWSISPWSECSQSCGANGGGYRVSTANLSKKNTV